MTEPVIHDAMVEAVADALGGQHPHTARAVLEDAFSAARALGATHLDLRSGELVTAEGAGAKAVIWKGGKRWCAHSTAPVVMETCGQGNHEQEPTFFLVPITPTEQET